MLAKGTLGIVLDLGPGLTVVSPWWRIRLVAVVL